jgi:hypothetical protein
LPIRILRRTGLAATTALAAAALSLSGLAHSPAAHAGLGTPQAGPFFPGNLLSYANSDFEGGTLNYVPEVNGNATLSLSTAHYLHSHSLQDTVGTAGTSAYKLKEGTGPTQIDLTPGATYTIGAYFKLSTSGSGQTVTFSLACYTSSGQWIAWQDSTPQSLDQSSTWKYAEGQVRIPSNCANVQGSPKFTLGGVQAGEVVNMDWATFKSYRGATAIGAHGNPCLDGACGNYTDADWRASDATGSTGIGPLQTDKEFFPTGTVLDWGSTNCLEHEAHLSPSAWPVCIINYADPVSQQTMNSFVQAIPPGQAVILTWHNEPEANTFSGCAPQGSSNGQQYVCIWKKQYAEYQAANPGPNVTMRMDAGSYQYLPGKNGADCSFLPPSDNTDGYMIDYYEHTVDGNNVATNANSGQAWVDWTNCVTSSQASGGTGGHKPIGLAEEGYDQSTTSNRNHTRAAEIADQSYLENYPATSHQPVDIWSYWWSNAGPNNQTLFDNVNCAGCMDQWKANETANGGA